MNAMQQQMNRCQCRTANNRMSGGESAACGCEGAVCPICGCNAAGRNMTVGAALPQNRGCSQNAAELARVRCELAQACFAVDEVVLYLDTHPNDPDALAFYQKKQQQRDAARARYEQLIGPLTAGSVNAADGWRWVQTPWPWQGEV